jgi:5'-nucleotidase/UDP-sugar diphosphatase
LAALQVYLDEIDARLGDVIATVPENICYDGIPSEGRSIICPVESTAERGGAACNLVSKAFLDQTRTADVSINALYRRLYMYDSLFIVGQ